MFFHVHVCAPRKCLLLMTMSSFANGWHTKNEIFYAFSEFYLQMGMGVGTTPGLHSWKRWLHSRASAAGLQSGLTVFSSFHAVWISSSWVSSGSE